LEAALWHPRACGGFLFHEIPPLASPHLCAQMSSEESHPCEQKPTPYKGAYAHACQQRSRLVHTRPAQRAASQELEISRRRDAVRAIVGVSNALAGSPSF
jgi:hypothetical protein